MNLETKARVLRTRYRSLQKRAASASGFKKVVSECVARAGRSGTKEDLSRAAQFAARKFKGKFRQDKKTPLFLHSLFLVEILGFFGEHDPETLFTALLHDTIEDTNTKSPEIRSLKLESTRKKILPLVLKLTQDKNISDELPKNSAISPRVRKFIKNLTGAPKEVVNVELADRIHDFLDVSYLKALEPERAGQRLANKIKRNDEIVSTITRGRRDINKSMLSFFKFLRTHLENRTLK